MAKSKNVKGRQVFDSRGNPTVEAEVFLDNNISATAISPSGASTGAFEAHELRDKDKNKFLGKSVNTAVDNINNKISSKLIGLDTDQQEKIDKTLIDLDGRIDARSKAQKQHRAKLEAAREKRIARREALASKFIETIKKKSIDTEMAYGSGHDTAKPMADMSNLNASKKKKKK